MDLKIERLGQGERIAAGSALALLLGCLSALLVLYRLIEPISTPGADRFCRKYGHRQAQVSASES